MKRLISGLNNNSYGILSSSGLRNVDVGCRLNSDIQKLRLIFCTRYKRSFAKQCTQ